MNVMLHRITTAYVPEEDRIRLSGQDKDGTVLVLWLTQRLCKQLLAKLLPLLNPPTGTQPTIAHRSSAAHMHLQAMAQSAARLEQRPVPSVPPDRAQESWVVRSVQLRIEQRRITLIWQGPNDAVVAVEMTPLLLRQWLNQVYDGWRFAGWPMAVWPNWMTETNINPEGAVLASFH